MKLRPLNPNSVQFLIGHLDALPKLRVSIRMRGAFLGLLVALKTITQLVQQRRHRLVAERITLLAQRGGQLPGAPTGPAEGGSGSPRVVGSTSLSSAMDNSGLVCVSFLRPPPLFRILPGGQFEASGPFSKSPRCSVVRDRPVA